MSHTVEPADTAEAVAPGAPATDGEALQRKPEVLARIGLSSAQLYRMIEAGTFPAPVILGAGGKRPRAVAWPKSEVDAWIAARIATRGAK